MKDRACGTSRLAALAVLVVAAAGIAASTPASGARGGPAVRKPAKAPTTTPSRPPVARPAAPLPAEPPPGNEIMKVSEVRPGMKGYGLTVFRGTRIERFDVEVVSVLPNTNLGQPLVLVKLSGGPITERSAFLIQGMSGSPVYLNGKLLGAFSQGNAWPKDALGMVTPIEDMLEALDPRLPDAPAQVTLDATPLAPVPATGAGALFSAPGDLPPSRRLTMQPLLLPVMTAGLTGARLDRAAELLRPFHMNVVDGPGSMGGQVKADLVPGAAIGVSLLSGDIEMTALGTVTYRDGDRVLAFGHPMMQLGAAQFPITTAYIHDVFSGFQVSHKIGSAGEVVGTLTQDRPFSVAGRVGPAPPTVPITAHVRDESTGRSRTFRTRAASHPLLVGQLVPLAVNQSVFTIRPVPGDATARIQIAVETEGAGTIRRENIAYDPFAIDSAAVTELTELMQLLNGNTFRRVPVKSVEMTVVLQDKRPTATVERIFLSNDTIRPGEEAEVGVVLRPYRRDPVVMKTRVRIPENAADGRAVLMVQGGATRLNLTSLLGGGAPGGLPGTPPPDASLDQVIRRFTERERNDQLAVRVVFPSQAVNVNGLRLSQLPSTLVDVMRSSRTTGFRIERDELRKVVDAEYIVQGVQAVAINVARDDHQEKPSGSRPGTSSGSVLPGAGSGSRPTPLSVEDEEEFSVLPRDGVLRLTVDGRPYLLRLTPSEDERPAPDEKKAAPAAPAAKPPATSPDSPRPAADPMREAAGPAPDDKLVGRQAKLWTQSTRADFERGTLTNTAVSSAGEVQLAPGLRLEHESTEQFVWSVAAVGGRVYAGTGSGGRVLRLEAGRPAAVHAETGELAVLALAADPQGRLYAGTAPSGRVLRIGADGRVETLHDLQKEAGTSDARFVLSLAVGDGVVYAGTGPEGRVLRIRADGSVDTVATLSGTSVTSLLLAGDVLYAGTAEDGAIHRIDLSTGRRAMVYDTSQAVVTGLARDRAGNLYAACSGGEIWRIEPDGRPRKWYSRSDGPLLGLILDASGNLYTCSGTSVVRVEPDGTATGIVDRKAGQFTCLTWEPSGGMVLGSANLGGVHRLAAAPAGTFESTVHDTKVPARWGRVRYTGTLPPGGSFTVETRSGDSPEPDATWSPWQELLAREGGGQYVQSPPARFLQYRVHLRATRGVPALREVSIAYLPRNQEPKLTLAVPAGGEVWRGVQTLRWSAQDPDGDTLTYELELSGDNGLTWKRLGPESGATPPKAEPPAPAAKPTRAGAEDALKRYRSQLDGDSRLSPQERDQAYEKAKSLIEKFMQENPQADPPKPGEAATGTPAAAPVASGGVTRTASYKWDTRQVPDGIYVLRVSVTDRASNPSEPRTDVRVSEPFIVANTAPELFVLERGIRIEEGLVHVTGMASGRVTLRGAQYRLGTGDWFAIEADDGLWDSASEPFRFSLPSPSAGEHSLEVKVVDAAGNVSLARVRFRVP